MGSRQLTVYSRQPENKKADQPKAGKREDFNTEGTENAEAAGTEALGMGHAGKGLG
jgi:hypothetical protein